MTTPGGQLELGACDWSIRCFRCTLPKGHPDDPQGHGGHLMARDLAIKWWGAKTTW